MVIHTAERLWEHNAKLCVLHVVSLVEAKVKPSVLAIPPPLCTCNPPPASRACLISALGIAELHGFCPCVYMYVDSCLVALYISRRLYFCVLLLNVDSGTPCFTTHVLVSWKMVSTSPS